MDKKRSPAEMLKEREITQLRGLLGSLQWPAVQTAPHLQCSTSLLAGQVTKATVQTVLDCNRLLKFAKDNKDIGLQYRHIGSPRDLRLLCFFDAGFSTRNDGTSQGGYVIMLVNGKLMESNEEDYYHVLDWRSFKTPRVARSSLGAEAQAGGQASDAVDFVSRYWHHLLDPDLSLKGLLEVQSSLRPVMVTDAKALYDAFHREATSSSVVDKRVSLEIRVMKERLQELGGLLKWMSSDRQVADGLTKEAARGLFATRLRHHRIKLTWDPSYTAMKKKTKGEKMSALAETTANHAEPDRSVSFEHPHVHEAPGLTEKEEVDENVNGGLHENAMVVSNHLPFVYVYASNHVACRSSNPIKSRTKNIMFWVILILMATTCQARSDMCWVNDTNTSEYMEDLGLLGLGIALILMLAHLCLWLCCKNKAASASVGVQKDEAVVPRRLRELLARETEENRNHLRACIEARKAMCLAQAENNHLLQQNEDYKALAKDGSVIIRRLLDMLDDHWLTCPHAITTVVSRQGQCWHREDCHLVEQMIPRNRQYVRGCSYCANPHSPIDKASVVVGNRFLQLGSTTRADAKPG